MSEPIKIGKVIIERNSGKALLCTPLDDLARECLGRPTWIPSSEIHDNSEAWKVGQAGVLVLKAGWWTERKGLT